MGAGAWPAEGSSHIAADRRQSCDLVNRMLVASSVAVPLHQKLTMVVIMYWIYDYYFEAEIFTQPDVLSNRMSAVKPC